MPQAAVLLARTALGAATRGRVRPAAAVAIMMNESCLPFSRVQAQMRVGRLRAATAGLLLTLLLAVVACLAAVDERLRQRHK